MPGSVVAASPALVLPLSLSRQFVHERSWFVFESTYAHGESQRRVIPATSRKRWRLAKRLTTAQLASLRTFYQSSMLGPLFTFFFYDGMETVPRWGWDATGASTTGRYSVRFENTAWAESLSIPRHEAEIRIIEVS